MATATDGNNNNGDSDGGNDNINNGGGSGDTTMAATKMVIVAMMTVVAAAVVAVANYRPVGRRSRRWRRRFFYSNVNLLHNQSFFTLHRKTTLKNLDCRILVH